MPSKMRFGSYDAIVVDDALKAHCQKEGIKLYQFFADIKLRDYQWYGNRKRDSRMNKDDLTKICKAIDLDFRKTCFKKDERPKEVKRNTKEKNPLKDKLNKKNEYQQIELKLPTDVTSEKIQQLRQQLSDDDIIQIVGSYDKMVALCHLAFYKKGKGLLK